MKLKRITKAIHKATDLILGKYEENNFDSRFFSAIVFIAVLVSIYATIINIILKLNYLITISTFVSGFIFLTIYLIVRHGGRLKQLRLIALFIAFFLFSLFWFLNAGSKGPVIFIFFVFYLYILFVMEGKVLLFILSFLTINISILYLVEYFHPEWVLGYETEFVRILDLFLGTVMFFGIGGLIIYYAKLNYLWEKRKAENSDKLKSSFLANMSHEIRTPMNSIIGFSQLLQKSELSKEKSERYLKILNENSKYLLRLIEDIIDISIIDSQQIKISKKKADISRLFNKLFVNFRQILDDSGKHLINLTVRLPQENLVVETDEIRLEQVLRNLLFNAVKFTHRGTISFGCRQEKDKLLFFVSDSGIGIRNKYLKDIFNRFTKIEDEHNRALFRGTGIGLSLCKDLVKLLGGNIWAESKYGEGSVFYFTLPNKPLKSTFKSQEQKSDSGMHFDWSDKFILIAEDEESNFEYLKELLEQTNIKIEWAKDGNEAIEITRASQPNLILMDIKMPHINGLDAAKIIRQFNAHIPIIAQTAYAMETDRQKCMEAGCNEYISKPVDGKKILLLLKKYLD